MRMIQTPACNDVLGAPKGTPIEECRALPIQRVVYADGAPAVRSFWRPTPEEIELLAAGKPVMLSVQGVTHAPLIVTVGDGTEDIHPDD